MQIEEEEEFWIDGIQEYERKNSPSIHRKRNINLIDSNEYNFTSQEEIL